MATFAPPQLPTSRPLHTDFAPSSPPDQPFYAMQRGPPEPMQTSAIAGNRRMQHSHSTDFKANGHTAGFANGTGGMPVPNGVQHHIPNGSSRHRGTVSMGAFDGPRSPPNTKNPQLYQQSDPALAHSLLAQQANGAPLPFTHQLPPYSEHELVLKHQQHMRDNLPTINTSDMSHAESKYGSPREDERNPISPIAHLSVLDAPMPASFDSQGISYIARHGAVAASMPSKFGIESPPNSLPAKAAIPTDAVRNLHSSAFGKESRARGPDLGSSPLGSGDEGFGQRIMHSKRVAKPGIMSASLPRARGSASDDWDDGLIFGAEEDFLPPSLHELLTPQERMRRLSRSEQDSRSHRESLSGIGTPADSVSKVGSPHNGSPSRYGALFARQKQEEANNPAAGFGHVGSPLRNSSLHPLASPSLRPTKMTGDMSPSFASPPRQSSMSMISQQLARAKISSQTSESNDNSNTHSNSTLQPGLARHPSTSSNLSNRAVSSGSIAGTGRIEEEQDGVFSMEEEEDDHRKRYSGNHAWGYSNVGKPAQQKVDAIGTGRSPGKGYWG
ncbi:hypothetical protein ACLMJK_000308 [Lecanora helva]